MSDIAEQLDEARSGREQGASLVEYALLVSLIAMVCFAAVVFFGSSTSAKFSNVSSEIGEATSG